MVKIYPSLLSADFGNLIEEIRRIEDAGADGLHFDVMDGQFVPNLSFGAPVLKWINGRTELELDCHLMVTEPAHLFEGFVKAGAHRITIHSEACKDLRGSLEAIRKLGCRAGIAIKPLTPFEVVEPHLDLIDLVLSMTVNPGFGGQALIPAALDKTNELILWLEKKNLRDKILVQIDGGVNAETAPLANRIGVDIMVAGNAVFGTDDYKKSISEIALELGEKFPQPLYEALNIRSRRIPRAHPARFAEFFIP